METVVRGRTSPAKACWLALLLLGVPRGARGSGVLMVTLGGTRSHTVPFEALGRALAARGHNVTLISGFPGAGSGWAEETPTPSLALFVAEEAAGWGLLARRLENRPLSPLDALRYAAGSCGAFLADLRLELPRLRAAKPEVAVLDGAFAECALGLAHELGAPAVLLNTVALYTGALAGSPEPFATTPFVGSGFTERMDLPQRLQNAALHLAARALNLVMVHTIVQPALGAAFGPGLPSVREMQRNVSFVLQNGHPSLTYARAFPPNVAEVACLHCRDPRPLPQDLEEFVSGAAPHGVVLLSMGSSVRAAAMPEALRRTLVAALGRLRQRVLWKWEGNATSFPEELPPNVRLATWLPQQDLLGHRGVVALVSHGGLLSMFEAVFHAKPLVALPVFCDHDANAAKAAHDGYAIRLELRGLTAAALAAAVNTVVRDPRFRERAAQLSRLLRDQPLPPLARAVFWTEFVARHRGAPHLRGRHVGLLQWLYLDALLLLAIAALIAWRLATVATRGRPRKLKQL